MYTMSMELKLKTIYISFQNKQDLKKYSMFLLIIALSLW